MYIIQADLLGDDVASTSVAPTTSTPVVQQSNQDLLAEIFGSSSNDAPSAAPVGSPTSSTPANPQRKAVDDILGLFDTSATPSKPAVSSASPALSLSAGPSLFDAASPSSPAPAPVPQPPKLPSYTAYDKHGLEIQLTPKAGQPGQVSILARFQVKESTPANGLNFQVAVPRTQQLQMLPMSSPDVLPGKTETQQMRILAPPGVGNLSFVSVLLTDKLMQSNIKLRLRVSFTLNGQKIEDQVDFAGFPPGLTNGA
jgi:AP-1 complex subunit gamma-1